jgi:hypothetical protein
MKRKIGMIVVLILVVFVILYQIPQPSNDRDWTIDQQQIPRVKLEGDRVSIENVRDFQYRSPTDYERRFVTRQFSLSKVRTVDFVLSQYAEWRGMAHAFLTFGYEVEGGSELEYLAISVEIRKEKGEEYSPVLGMFKQYELAYVIATETDVIQLRTHHRQEPIYLYPIQVEEHYVQQLLKSMLQQTHQLEDTPEFYHTVNNSCMSNIAKHVNLIQPDLVPFGMGTVFPGFADDIVLERNLLSTDVEDIELVREYYRINERALKSIEGQSFSQRIRIE